MPAIAGTTYGMAWVDPVCMMTRGKKTYPAFPLAVYFVLAVVILIVAGLQPPAAILLAAIGPIVAIAVEKPNIMEMDDDFVMVFVPFVVLGLLDYLIV